MIPRWAILKAQNVPDQCLNLRPSLSVGPSYRCPGEEDGYAQSNIIYRLKTYVESEYLQDSTLPRSLQASRKIVILPCSMPIPPTDTSDFPAEFVSSVSHTYRKFFIGPWYTMTLSMVEPEAISLQDVQTCGAGRAMLHVEVQSAACVMDTTSARTLLLSLKDFSFKIQPILRAKTFYSTQPFRKMPGQTMLTLRGFIRMKDEVIELDSHDLKASSWQHNIAEEAPLSADIYGSSPTSARSGSINSGGSVDACKVFPTAGGPPRVWSARLPVPITIQPSLPPTFCCATASRQYSLITRIRVSSISTKDFVLEAPLQIFYATHGDPEHSSKLSTSELQPCFTSVSHLDELLYEARVSLTFCSRLIA